MEIKIGIPVSPGVAIAHAYVLDSEYFRIPKRFIRKDEVELELKRFNTARENAMREVQEIRDGVHGMVKDEVGLIFDTHLKMLEDPMGGARPAFARGTREGHGGEHRARDHSRGRGAWRASRRAIGRKQPRGVALGARAVLRLVSKRDSSRADRHARAVYRGR
jgi:hypothetical protein